MAARFDAGSIESYGAVQAAGANITVPDAALLFTGDYSRAGSDLFITGADGAKFVVAGYFETDTPPTLVSPTGGSLTGDVVTALAGPQYPGMYAQAGGGGAAGLKEIGKVQTLDGSASVVRANGVTETLSVGDPVYEGDVVQTGPGSKLGIGFVDGTVFSMSNNARMVLNKLIFNPDGQDNSMLFSLVEGSFVFASGKIAPTGDMKIQTPVATMGIRGTAPTVDIVQTALGQVVNFSIVPNPDDQHTGSYVLLNSAGDVIGTISDTGSTWSLDINGTITQFEKSQDDLLKDAETISQINSVYSTYQNNTQNPQAGPENTTPPSSGLNTNQNNNENIDGNTNNNNEGGSQNQNNEGENNAPPSNSPPPFNQTNDPPPIEDPTEGAGINVIIGTEFNDNSGDGETDQPELVGTDGSDFISGFGGNDVIYDHGGNDFVEAGDGDDIIVAGAGDDDYDGGDGTDGVDYSDTDQSVVINIVSGEVDSAKFGFDTIANLERFVTGSGNDTFIFGAHIGWTFDGGEGVDTIQVEGSQNIDTSDFDAKAYNFEIIDLNEEDPVTLTISAEDIHEANDKGENGTGSVRILGTGSDILNLTNELTINDQQVSGWWQPVTAATAGFIAYEFVDSSGTVQARVEVDEDIQVNTGPEPVIDEQGQNFFIGDNGMDIYLGLGGKDFAFGNRGDDFLYGNGGKDTLFGGRGNDYINGGNGEDLIFGNRGSDYLFGGKDADYIVGDNALDLGRGIRNLLSGSETQTNNSDDVIHGDGGRDEIVGDSVGGFTGGEGANDTIFGGGGKDTIVGDNRFFFFTEKGGDDFIDGGNGNDFIVGDHSDIAFGTVLGGNDTILGGKGDDRIFGDHYNIAFGNEIGGDDTITGGLGIDTMTGGGGENVYVYNSVDEGGDTITDFTGLDAFDLSEFLADAIASVLPDGDELSSVINQFVQAITDSDGNTAVKVDADGAENGSDFSSTLATLESYAGGVTVIIGQHEAEVTPVA